MKKKVYKILATALAMAFVIASPATSITSHALGFNADAHDDTDRGKRPSSSDNASSNSSDNASSSSSDSGSSYDSGSSNSGSNYDGGSNHGFNANAHDDTDYGVKPSNNANDVVVRVTGGQTFRSVMNADHTVYQVYHCGISRASFKVTDADDNVVAFKTVTLEQGEDKLWYENITFAQGVETKDFTVTVTAGDASYLSKELGVSGIKVNGTLVLSTVPATEAE